MPGEKWIAWSSASSIISPMTAAARPWKAGRGRNGAAAMPIRRAIGNRIGGYRHAQYSRDKEGGALPRRHTSDLLALRTVSGSPPPILLFS